MTFPAAVEVQGVFRTLANQGDSGVLILGYPLWIYSDQSSETDPFLKPIFMYTLEYEVVPGGFRVSSEDPIADINLDWLSYAMKSEEQKRAFLTVAGLMERRGREEETGDGTGALLRPDLRSLATAAATFFGKQIREPLSPDSLTRLNSKSKPVTGIYNHAVLMAANRTRYAQSLLKDLGAITKCTDEELDRTALVSVFKYGATVANDQLQEPASVRAAATTAETCELNSEQRLAVASLMKDPLTVVTGPPGTGKSQVVASAIANARLTNQTVLFSSRNHKAIDAVVHRPEMRTRDDIPLIVRANDKEGVQSFHFEDAIKELLTAPHDPSSEGTREGKCAQLSVALAERGSLAAEAEVSIELRDSLAGIELELTNLSAHWENQQVACLDQSPEDFPSKLVDRLSRTLERSKRRSPNFWGRLYLRLNSFRIRRAARVLNRLLTTAFPRWRVPSDLLSRDSRRDLESRVSELKKASRYCQLRVDQRPIEKDAAGRTSIDLLLPRIESLTSEITRTAAGALDLDAKARQGLPPEADRSSLASLRVALRRLSNPLISEETRIGADQALRQSLAMLMRHFPAWAVTNLSIGSRIPLVPGLFDVAIIDEASQCDIASAIPVLFRAKRAGVVGDPFQLSHTTKLSRSRDNVICRRRGVTSIRDQRFSYPDTSLFDLFAQSEGVTPVLLADHYRCAPEIAEYANRVFYGSRLRVLTAADRLRVPRGKKAGIHWTNIESEFEARRTGCIAPLEVEECTRQLKQLLLEDSFKGTVGVVTPFREQRDFLYQAIMSDSALAEAGSRGSLIVHTAHGFQGDERDVMFMSLCAGPGMPTKSLGWLRQNGNLLNVAVTRARAVLHVIGNRSWALHSQIPHLSGLAIGPSGAARKTDEVGNVFESPWERRLYEALVAKGIRPIPQFSMMGRRLDLALIQEGKVPIDIEVDGARFHLEPDGSRRRDDIWRDIMVRGAGWRVMRFWVRDLRDRMPGCVKMIETAWAEQ